MSRRTSLSDCASSTFGSRCGRTRTSGSIRRCMRKGWSAATSRSRPMASLRARWRTNGRWWWTLRMRRRRDGGRTNTGRCCAPGWPRSSPTTPRGCRPMLASLTGALVWRRTTSTRCSTTAPFGTSCRRRTAKRWSSAARATPAANATRSTGWAIRSAPTRGWRPRSAPASVSASPASRSGATISAASPIPRASRSRPNRSSTSDGLSGGCSHRIAGFTASADASRGSTGTRRSMSCGGSPCSVTGCCRTSGASPKRPSRRRRRSSVRWCSHTRTTRRHTTSIANTCSVLGSSSHRCSTRRAGCASTCRRAAGSTSGRVTCSMARAGWTLPCRSTRCRCSCEMTRCCPWSQSPRTLANGHGGHSNWPFAFPLRRRCASKVTGRMSR